MVKSNTTFELDGGKTATDIWWNNAAPAQAVWSANAVAESTGGYTGDVGGFNQDTKLEVTRLWRRFKVTEKIVAGSVSTDIETEIHCEVKNLGGSKAKFKVYWSAVW